MARKIRSKVAALAAALTGRYISPGLAVILADDTSASSVCLDLKINARADVGIKSRYYRFKTKVTQAKVAERIDELNRDPGQVARVHEAPSRLHWSGAWASR